MAGGNARSSAKAERERESGIEDRRGGTTRPVVDLPAGRVARKSHFFLFRDFGHHFRHLGGWASPPPVGSIALPSSFAWLSFEGASANKTIRQWLLLFQDSILLPLNDPERRQRARQDAGKGMKERKEKKEDVSNRTWRRGLVY